MFRCNYCQGFDVK